MLLTLPTLCLFSFWGRGVSPMAVCLWIIFFSLCRMEWWCWVQLTDTRKNMSLLCSTSLSERQRGCTTVLLESSLFVFCCFFLFLPSHLAKSCTETSLQVSSRPMAVACLFFKGCTPGYIGTKVEKYVSWASARDENHSVAFTCDNYRQIRNRLNHCVHLRFCCTVWVFACVGC